MMDDQKGLNFICAMLNSSLEPSAFGPLWQVLSEGQNQSEGIEVKELNPILLRSCYKVIGEEDVSTHLCTKIPSLQDDDDPQSFQLSFTTLIGIRIDLQVKPTTTIAEMKQQISLELEIPVDQLLIFWSGILQDDDATYEKEVELKLRLGKTIDLQKPEQKNQKTFNIFVKTLTGKTMNFKVKSTDAIRDVKVQIQIVNGIPVDEQRLIYCGIQLKGGKTLMDYNIEHGHTLELGCKWRGGAPSLSLPRSLLNPRYHKDFTKIMDQIVFRRGGEIYKRPCGCYRYALRVDGKYADDVWLGGSTNPLSELIGNSGERRDTLDGEWPVSYHGTSYNNGLSIAEEGFQLSKGQRFLYGRGIYSTPDIDVAFLYAPTVELRGKEYKIVIQNRVNPVGLIKVGKEETGVGEYWISACDDDVRPYGFCVQEVNKTANNTFNCVIL